MSVQSLPVAWQVGRCGVWLERWQTSGTDVATEATALSASCHGVEECQCVCAVERLAHALHGA